jgi:cyclophilin family peptidyl-prolyl cis-trans isomerase
VKTKTNPRRPAPLDLDEPELPELWRQRPWAPVLIVAILIAAVLGTGLMVERALGPQIPTDLANCKTAVQIAPHQYIGRQPMCINAKNTYTATVNTTQGPIVIQLHPDIAPVTVNNFIVLAIHGYYDGLVFWKSEDWVLQGGDPRGDGRGGPGYSLPDEPSSKPWGLGAVGMARVPGGAVNGSQFFIQKGPWPDTGPTAAYNRFGTVISGMDKAQQVQPLEIIKSISIKVS